MSRTSPSAIVAYLSCEHLAALDKAAREGHLTRPVFADPSRDLLQQLGDQHEQRYLAHLRTQHAVTEISKDLAREDAAAATLAAMRAGAEVIFQAVFLTDRYFGIADFLIKVPRASSLGSWSYEAIDTKLARSTKASALVQLCFYSAELERIQGTLPEHMHVELGGGVGRQTFRVSSFIAYFRRVRAQFEAHLPLLDHTQSYPEPNARCDTCDWSTRCDAQWRKDDHLTLVAGIKRRQRDALVAAGVDTLAKLGRLSHEIPDLRPSSLTPIREQARVQLEGREAGRMLWEHRNDVEPHAGLAALPAPSPGDVFFDIEGDPYAYDTGLEYLLGLLPSPLAGEGTPERSDGEGEGAYRAYWSLSPAEEKLSFERFVDDLVRRREAHPDLHIYHYNHYEPTALKRLAGRHNTRADIIDDWSRNHVFVDLYRILLQSIRASVESYSLKKIEPLFSFTRTVPLRTANESLTAFESWLTLGGPQHGDRSILDTIAAYNRDDCVSTFALRTWLEDRRKELGDLPRPVFTHEAPKEELTDYLERVRTIDRALNDANQPLMANLLLWHRREESATWREYFRLCDLSEPELLSDATTLGGLRYEGVMHTVKRSSVHRYRFPPQDHAIEVGDDVHDPATKKSAGKVYALTDDSIDLLRGNASAAPHPQGLFPHESFATITQRESVLRLGSWIVTHGVDADGFCRAGRDLLLSVPPRLRAGESLALRRGETSTEQAVRVSLALDGGVLAIQGPPGAGKTHTGGKIIEALVAAGRTVGVVANSHRVVSNLLACLPRNLRILQRGPETDACSGIEVDASIPHATVADRLASRDVQVVGSTVWLFAHEAMREAVDVLVVDEAGQLSLANVLAASQCARNLILLGDPRQLEQPQKGAHPPGADASALSHLLGEHATMPSDRGIFLPESRRMHPDVCSYISEMFYEGRLSSHASAVGQGCSFGTGLSFVKVEHAGNTSESPEEVAAVAVLLRRLTGGSWTDASGVTKPITLADVLIVSPYNAQVSALRKALPDGARVGTVDKFQGGEGAIVVYSMAASSAADAPRGLEFLFSPNRLNVAVSRAKCLAIVVACPAVVDAVCTTPRQMELANALARYSEVAGALRSP